SLSPASWPPRPRERLKPHAIGIRVNIDPVHWFLRSQSDTRSSLYLEDAATEFQAQGMVIFVPPGAKRDRTRSPGFYEGVSQYLTDLGVPQV
ncbi:MAG: hypothetical protein EBT85_06070, partial [Synechococcaceae bacterium WB5_2B_268]|nr:hypothetical protein [Synechococcaceae bacterium WB5_2B_268]